MKNPSTLNFAFTLGDTVSVIADPLTSGVITALQRAPQGDIVTIQFSNAFGQTIWRDFDAESLS
jgi:hypothetical protein